jgi:hypothetical protein
VLLGVFHFNSKPFGHHTKLQGLDKLVPYSKKFVGGNFHDTRLCSFMKISCPQEMPKQYCLHLTGIERSELKALLAAGKAAAP